MAIAVDKLSAKPEFTKIVAQSNEGKSMGSVKVYVGTIPDYSYSGPRNENIRCKGRRTCRERGTQS